jgi:HAE1 family hydrophobic/amphiphilic exporter-1
MREGMSSRDAILESVRTRIRPIFITAVTTVVGLLPLVLFPGAGSELYRGLGSVLLGGLTLSTVFTLILVPTVFDMTMEARDWVTNRLKPASVAAAHRRPIPVEGEPAVVHKKLELPEPAPQ